MQTGSGVEGAGDFLVLLAPHEHVGSGQFRRAQWKRQEVAQSVRVKGWQLAKVVVGP